MTAILPQQVQDLLFRDGIVNHAAVLGVLAILLLVTLLVEKEVLRAAARRRSLQEGNLLDAAIIPLVFVFSFVVLEHFYRLIF